MHPVSEHVVLLRLVDDLGAAIVPLRPESISCVVVPLHGANVVRGDVEPSCVTTALFPAEGGVAGSGMVELSIDVAPDATLGMKFELKLTTSIDSLPLTIGPITVSTGADWGSPPPAPLWRDWDLPHLPCNSIRRRVRVAEAPGTVEICERLWDASFMLGLYLADCWANGTLREMCNCESTEPLRCIELGAGSGVAGLSLAIAAGHGARVLLTDGDARAVALAKQNVSTNDVEATVRTFALSWGGMTSDLNAHPWCWEKDAQPSAWLAPHLVIAADVVYEEPCFEALVQTLEWLCNQHASAAASHTSPGSGTVALLAYRKRMHDDTRFWQLLRAAFFVEEVSSDVRAAARIFKLRHHTRCENVTSR